MKALYYSAFAPPHVVPALATQVHESLRPYVAYLNAAINSARSREDRSRCRWTAVPQERTLRLRPLDTLIELQSDGFLYTLDGPPPHDLQLPLFLGPHFRPVQPTRVDSTPAGIVIRLPDPLGPNEVVWWGGARCVFRETSAWPEGLLARHTDGSTANILHRAQVGNALRIVVEGTAPVNLESQTNPAIQHHSLAPHEGASELLGNKTQIRWSGESELLLQELPDVPVFLADNGTRWAWTEENTTGRRRRGVWIQLLSSDASEDESTIDPRAAFCDEGACEVRTHKGGNPANGYRILGFRRDSYRLELDRLPPDGSTVFLPSNVSGLRQQLQAVYQLKDAPLPHHRSLLTLCEQPDRARWTKLCPAPVSQWYLLHDARWDGTLQQRELVQKALSTADFAFLEGPPGSGKTHAICELVLQLIERGQRVLLCSTTHVAVDNVLERLVANFPQVEAVRIGLTDRVDPRVRSCQLDARTDALTQLWRESGVFTDLDPQQLDRAAEDTVLATANLTCGTATGILSHPYFRRGEKNEAPRWPHFDVLILDEASKTTFQEFLVPAQLATRWVIVGDVRQLPPFTNPSDLEASLHHISDDCSRSFPDAHQRACLLLFRLCRPEAGAGATRWLISEPPEVLDALVTEINARRAKGTAMPEVIHIVERASASHQLSLADIQQRTPQALRLLAVNWVLVSLDILSRVERFLPVDLLRTTSLPHASPQLEYRFRHYNEGPGKLTRPIRDGRDVFTSPVELSKAQQEFLREQSWAGQLSWRLGRVHQLSSARNDKARQMRQQEIDALLPVASGWGDITHAVDAIRDVGVRSVIESLRVRRADHRVRRKSALTEAIPDDVWASRSVLLSHQHRMHPQISALPRELFYEKTALQDANTLEHRETKSGWTFLPHAARRCWLDVQGTEHKGLNLDEIAAVERVLRRWMTTTSTPRRDGRPWEIACLSFYHRQEIGMRDMLRRLTGMQRAETRFELPHTHISCGTVDRFQGREADLVLLSLRNTRRPGHLDSPNRLNVAITRARHMLILVGNRPYFAQRCPSEELTALAQHTPLLDLGAHS